MTSVLTKPYLLPAIVAAGLQVATFSSAHADWYTETTLLQTNLDNTSLNSTGRNADIAVEDEITFAGSIGYQFDANSAGTFRIEGEYLVSDNDVTSVNFNNNVFSGANVAGSLETQSVFVNAIQSFGSGAVQPYVGAGIGYTRVESDAAYNPTLSAVIDDSDSTFSYQLLAGLDIPFSERFTGFVEYRYVDVGNVDLNRVGGGPGGVATTSQSGDINVEAFGVGLRYQF